MSSKSGKDQEQCYICLDTRKPLVSCCKHCNAIVHQLCINEQFSSGIDRCGKCRNQLLVTTSVKHECRCTNPTYKSLLNLHIFLSFIYYYFLIQGKSLVTPNFISVFLSLVIIFITQLTQYALLRENFIDSISLRKFIYLVAGLTVVPITIIMISHGIGYGVSLLGIMESVQDIQFFTFDSFIIGFLTFILVGIGLLGINALFGLVFLELYRYCVVKKEKTDVVCESISV